MPQDLMRTMNTFKADLHIHTNFSDGTFSPAEILQKAKKAGLAAISITDHDTFEGFVSVLPLAKNLGIILGPGVEFSTTYQTQNIHVLGYDFDSHNSDLLCLCKKHTLRREERNHAILKKLSSKGMVIEYDELLSLTKKTLGRVHIATLMVQKKFVSSIEEAFALYIGNGQSCFIAGDPFPMEEAIEILHSAKGKAILAHPYLYPDAIVERAITSFPFDGIEIHYGNPSPEKKKQWKAFAQSKNLICSGGSDFHGSNDTKPYQALGANWIDESTFFSIFTNFIT